MDKMSFEDHLAVGKKIRLAESLLRDLETAIGGKCAARDVDRLHGCLYQLSQIADRFNKRMLKECGREVNNYCEMNPGLNVYAMESNYVI